MFQTPAGKGDTGRGDSSRSLDQSPASAATPTPTPTQYNPCFGFGEKTTPPKVESVATRDASTQTREVALYQVPKDDVVYTAAQLKGPPYGPYAGYDAPFSEKDDSRGLCSYVPD